MTQTIGIIGGIGCGKSTVSGIFLSKGATVFNADQAGHLLLSEPEIKQAVRQRWGEQVFTPKGNICRKKIAQLVFSMPGELDFLNKLLHPLITERFLESLESCRKSDIPFFILDAPLLLETRMDKYCDVILFINTDIESRWERVAKRGWTRSQFEAREKSQISLEKKRKKADFVIDNNSTLDKMKEEVGLVIERLTAQS